MEIFCKVFKLCGVFFLAGWVLIVSVFYYLLLLFYFPSTLFKELHCAIIDVSTVKMLRL